VCPERGGGREGGREGGRSAKRKIGGGEGAGGKEEEAAWQGASGACSLLPDDRVHRLLLAAGGPKIENVRRGRASETRFFVESGDEEESEIGRGPRESSRAEVHPPREGNIPPIRSPECSSLEHGRSKGHRNDTVARSVSLEFDLSSLLLPVSRKQARVLRARNRRSAITCTTALACNISPAGRRDVTSSETARGSTRDDAWDHSSERNCAGNCAAVTATTNLRRYRPDKQAWYAKHVTRSFEMAASDRRLDPRSHARRGLILRTQRAGHLVLRRIEFARANMIGRSEIGGSVINRLAYYSPLTGDRLGAGPLRGSGESQAEP